MTGRGLEEMMTRLAQAILNDPAAVFDFECTLPSGNTMRGSIGPLIGGRLVASVVFENQPPSEEDKADAQYVLSCMIGQPPADAKVVSSKEELSRTAREFLGGGQG